MDEGHLRPDHVTDDVKEGKRLPQLIGGAAPECAPSGFRTRADNRVDIKVAEQLRNPK
jgi:hypothetical protein